MRNIRHQPSTGAAENSRQVLNSYCHYYWFDLQKKIRKIIFRKIRKNFEKFSRKFSVKFSRILQFWMATKFSFFIFLECCQNDWVAEARFPTKIEKVKKFLFLTNEFNFVFWRVPISEISTKRRHPKNELGYELEGPSNVTWVGDWEPNRKYVKVIHLKNKSLNLLKVKNTIRIIFQILYLPLRIIFVAINFDLVSKIKRVFRKAVSQTRLPNVSTLVLGSLR